MLTAFVLILLAVAYRLALAFTGSLHDVGAWNFAPVAAIALCGGIYLRGRIAAALPLAILLLSDLILNLHYQVALFDVQMLVRYVALALTVGLGFAIRRSPNLSKVLTGSLAASTLFFVLTNTSSWLESAAYSKNFGGWLQALTTGVPGFPPTILFFRNTIVSDLLFTFLFVACHALTTRRIDVAPAAEAPTTACTRENVSA